MSHLPASSGIGKRGERPDTDFRDQVYAYVAAIPAGRFMTYGQLAALCGHPYAAHVVGTIAHFGPSDLPWHRVVNKSGCMASGFPGGKNGHKSVVEAENVVVRADYTVDIANLLWKPASL